MTQVSPEWLSWAEFSANVGQFLFGLFTFLLAVYVVLIKYKDLFKTELAKKQLDELGNVRASLQAIFFDFHYIPLIKNTLEAYNCNLSTLEECDKESWEQYQRYKKNSLDLFYKFSDGNYYLFPEWIDKKKRQQFADAMTEFAPFTLNAVLAQTEEKRAAYALEISKMKNYIDDSLKVYG